jgi:prepilin-type N-terminal cleavage/methylation domain-containing protein
MRKGYTLVELLVAVGVIGILCALVLAAAQASRESGRRAFCANNFRQIGLALSNYEQLNGVFAPINLYTYQDNKGGVATELFSPHARMLAQLEHNDIYSDINFSYTPAYPAALRRNKTVMTTSLSVFVCPADAMSPVAGYGRNNIRFCVGPTSAIFPWDAESSSGPFTAVSAYRAANFADGLSYTIGASERLQGDWIKDAVKSGGDYAVGSLMFEQIHVTSVESVKICEYIVANTGATGFDSKGGETWFLTGYHTTMYNHCNVPNTGWSDCSFDNYGNTMNAILNRSGVFSASSHHRGGVNVLRMDGGVQFVRDTIYVSVWRGLATRSGGELVSMEY